MFSVYKQIDEIICKEFSHEIDPEYDPPDTSSTTWPVIFQADVCRLAQIHGVRAVKEKVEGLEREFRVNLHVSWPKIMEDVAVRSNWEAALKHADRGRPLSKKIDWAFFPEDLLELIELHEKGKYRKKIEDLLEDCNFHGLSGDLSRGDYEKARKEIKDAD